MLLLANQHNEQGEACGRAFNIVVKAAVISSMCFFYLRAKQHARRVIAGREWSRVGEMIDLIGTSRSFRNFFFGLKKVNYYSEVFV